MASSKAPDIQAFLADAIVAKGKAVKVGTDDNHVAVCSAKTDLSIGIVQNLTTAGGIAEIAVGGGGAKALLGGSVNFGDALAPTTDGSLIATTTGNDRIVAIAMQGGVSGDLIDVNVALSNY